MTWIEVESSPLTWEIPIVAVATGRQRRRLGHALFAALVQEARSVGVHQIELWIHRDNEPMLKVVAKFDAHLELGDDRVHFHSVVVL